MILLEPKGKWNVRNLYISTKTKKGSVKLSTTSYIWRIKQCFYRYPDRLTIEWHYLRRNQYFGESKDIQRKYLCSITLFLFILCHPKSQDRGHKRKYIWITFLGKRNRRNRINVTERKIYYGDVGHLLYYKLYWSFPKYTTFVISSESISLCS